MNAIRVSSVLVVFVSLRLVESGPHVVASSPGSVVHPISIRPMIQNTEVLRTQTAHWSLFSLSEAVAFHQTNTDDQYHTIITLVNALVVSRIDYCNAVLAGMHDVHLRQLRVLNAAARLIARKRKYDSISATLRDALHWLPIRQHVEFNLSVLVFN